MALIQIEKVKTSDLVALQHISKSTFMEAFGPPHNTEYNMAIYVAESFNHQKLSEEIVHPESEFYFAKKEGVVVGYLKINIGKAQTEMVEGDNLELQRIYVDEAYRNQKIGQLLLDYAIELARKYKKESIWLGVWEKNDKAIRFYERNGFEPFSKHIFLMVDDPQTDVLMKRILK